MAKETLSRFQLLDDDQLQGLINSADSKNTKRVREILHKNIEIKIVGCLIAHSVLCAKILPIEIAHIHIQPMCIAHSC